jgi:ATP-dependent protease ClpP protease subunit
MKASSKILSPVQMGVIVAPPEPVFNNARTLRYIGSITRATNERLLTQMEKLLAKSAEQEINLFVTCTGGATGSAMSFYDTVKHILKPKLVTIGSGDVDSSGILIFLAGEKRYVTARTTLLLHPAGRVFDGTRRYTTLEMEAMLAEDKLKDMQYASVVADSSKGNLTPEQVLEMMANHTVLSPSSLVGLGLADEILP